MSKKYLLSAIFAVGALSVTTSAGDMQVLNEEDLDEVSAQGLQTISNDTRDFGGQINQENNLDSVQMNDSAQQNAKGADLVEAATSSLNLGINILWSDSEPSEPEDAVKRPEDGTFPVVVEGPNAPMAFGHQYEQKNKQYAYNHVNTANGSYSASATNENKESQDIYNNVHKGDDEQGNIVSSSVAGQDNNNSVQLNDFAQQNAEGLSIANIAKVALNSGFNVMWISGATTDSNIMQKNDQLAGNHNNYAEATGESGTALAMNHNKQRQWIENCYCANINGQNNNQNSVQVNDYAQQNVRGWHVLNAATSAVNMGTNIAVMKGDVSGSTLTQMNIQSSYNFSNTAVGTDATATNMEVEFPD